MDSRKSHKDANKIDKAIDFICFKRPEMENNHNIQS